MVGVNYFAKLLKNIDLNWLSLRNFFYDHKTLFDIFFLIIYTFEQIFLFLLILIDANNASLYSGVFALVVITTISLEKICMESRYSYFKKLRSDAYSELLELTNQYSRVLSENIELRAIVQKNL